MHWVLALIHSVVCISVLVGALSIILQTPLSSRCSRMDVVKYAQIKP